MCHRISPLVIEELREAVEALRETGRARVPRRDPTLNVPDAYPGKQVALLAPNRTGELDALELTWGFVNPQISASKLVFNTRIETALAQARSGSGLWAEAITCGRCLVPVRAFFESWTREPPRRGAQLRFTLPGHGVFLLAGVRQGERFSVVTTAPNASVSPLHSRMPLVLGPGESSLWLSGDYARLIDRSGIALNVKKDV